MKRRQLLRSGAATMLAAPFAQFSVAFTQRGEQPPLQAVADESTGLPLLKLAEGFSYRSFGWTGDIMVGGSPTPDRHDGMAAFPGSNGGPGNDEVVLLRNHERIVDTPITGANVPTYDDLSWGAPRQRLNAPAFGGGVSAVTLVDGQYESTRPALAGTIGNCAGGPTPWDSWLTCEEFVLRAGVVEGLNHGYVFEVPAHGRASAVPIVDMGCFRHEAAAVDPATGAVYLTEDNGPNSGFYRFLPKDPTPAVGALEAGGRLEMLKVKGQANADLRVVERGATFDVQWVPIGDPDADPENIVAPSGGGPAILGTGKSGPYLQGEAGGGARFARGEGCWHQDGFIYWTDTVGGAAASGVVWIYDPQAEQLRAYYVSPSKVEADALDNITMTAGGTLLVCEDSHGLRDRRLGLVRGTRLLAIDTSARVRSIAENHMLLSRRIKGKRSIRPADYRGAEWAGATFSPDGQTLFVNIQTPGVTFAIKGPWT
jgi:secreted PhoX family phosphatase